MKLSVKAAMLIALLTVFTPSIFPFENMNRQIGIIYLKNAAAYYLTGDFLQAERFLEKTSEFYDTSSDIEYLNGLIVLKRDNNINLAEDYFFKAVSNRNWILLEKKDCVSDLAMIMFRKKEYSRLVDIIENESFPDYNDNDLMYVYLLSLKRLGEHTKFEPLLRRSIIRYPDDYRFALLYSEENTAYSASILKGGLSFKNPEGGRLVFLKAALRLDDGSAKRKALEEYFGMGGKDIGAYIEYYRLRGGISRKELEDLLKKDFFGNPENRLRLAAILPSTDMRKSLNDAWNSYTGNVYYDSNDDGYYEELHLFENGKPVGISIDNDQDGIIEAMLIFGNGVPSEVIIEEEQSVDIIFDAYPSVSEISIADGDRKRVFTLLKKRVELPVFSYRGSDNKIEFLKSNVEDLISDEDSLVENSVRITTYTSESGISNPYDYLSEEIERRDEYYTIMKTYNEINGNFIYQRYNNIKTSGFGDIDYDSIIDFKQSFSDGKLVSIEVDENKNGIYDYKLSFENEAAISWWDFNEDGIYDCRQYEEGDILVDEYSSGLDGIFDIVERK